MTSLQWFRHSMKVVGTLDKDTQLLRLPRVVHHELSAAREILIPTSADKDPVEHFRHQLVFRDSTGDLSMLFLDPKNRLVQYSHSRSQFRDILRQVAEFKVWRSSTNRLEYELVRQSKQGPESIFGTFIIPLLKSP
ncbi:hypothetical protein HOF92_02655 [bacterium]|jgi:hypothetical protein|nr:hypothetical protein [bacterium]